MLVSISHLRDPDGLVDCNCPPSMLWLSIPFVFPKICQRLLQRVCHFRFGLLTYSSVTKSIELESPLLVALILPVELQHRICTELLVPFSNLIRTIIHHGLHRYRTVVVLHYANSIPI